MCLERVNSGIVQILTGCQLLMQFLSAIIFTYVQLTCTLKTAHDKFSTGNQTDRHASSQEYSDLCWIYYTNAIVPFICWITPTIILGLMFCIKCLRKCVLCIATPLTIGYLVASFMGAYKSCLRKEKFFEHPVFIVLTMLGVLWFCLFVFTITGSLNENSCTEDDSLEDTGSEEAFVSVNING